jgi:hypothetical protein
MRAAVSALPIGRPIDGGKGPPPHQQTAARMN